MCTLWVINSCFFGGGITLFQEVPSPPGSPPRDLPEEPEGTSGRSVHSFAADFRDRLLPKAHGTGDVGRGCAELWPLNAASFRAFGEFSGRMRLQTAALSG